MTSELNDSPQTSNKPFRTEKERGISGIGLVIVARGVEGEPLIWTIVEQNPKEETRKQKGQISIPAETLKRGENIRRNVLGALGEFCNDEVLDNPEVTISVVRGYPNELILSNSSMADLITVIYEGPLDIQIKPVASDEVSPNGWKSLEELRAAENIRPLLKEFIEKNDSAAKLVSVLYSKTSKKVDVRGLLPPGMSLEDFSARREKRPDVVNT